MKNSKLVWSDDPKDRERLQADAGPAKIPEVSDEFIKSGAWTAVFRIEKSGRGGKTVTVIDQLPRQERFLKELCKELKAKCGTGGTHLMNELHGLIEIQGDKREMIKSIFEKKSIRYKGM